MRKPSRVSPTLSAFLPRHAIVMARQASAPPSELAITPSVAPFSLEGNPASRLWILTDAKFTDAESQLLEKMLEAIGTNRASTATLVVSDRNDIAAAADEIERGKAVVLVSLGAEVAQALLKTSETVAQLRGSMRDYRTRRLMPTHHPRYLLETPAAKREAWSDLQLVARELGLAIPGKAKPGAPS